VDAALSVAIPSGEACQVSLLVTGDETVRGLNRDYRGLDEVTDVLSFSPTHSGLWKGETEASLTNPDSREQDDPLSFVYPSDEPALLGEVVISYPQTMRQAAENGRPVDRELALLIVHGTLHLAGHDHLEPESEAAMQAKERTALALIPEAAT